MRYQNISIKKFLLHFFFLILPPKWFSFKSTQGPKQGAAYKEPEIRYNHIHSSQKNSTLLSLHLIEKKEGRGKRGCGMVGKKSGKIHTKIQQNSKTKSARFQSSFRVSARSERKSIETIERVFRKTNCSATSCFLADEISGGWLCTKRRKKYCCPRLGNIKTGLNYFCDVSYTCHHDFSKSVAEQKVLWNTNSLYSKDVASVLTTSSRYG
jgi:hypothetical protein